MQPVAAVLGSYCARSAGRSASHCSYKTHLQIWRTFYQSNSNTLWLKHTPAKKKRSFCQTTCQKHCNTAQQAATHYNTLSLKKKTCRYGALSTKRIARVGYCRAAAGVYFYNNVLPLCCSVLQLQCIEDSHALAAAAMQHVCGLITNQYMCDTTHACAWHNPTRSHVWRDSSICVGWFIHMCNMTHPHVWHDWFMFATRRIHTWDMTHSCVWRDSFACVT